MEFPFLKQTSAWNALSFLGRNIYLPQGIFYWSGRAAKEAQVNGTIGIAQNDDGVISHLPLAEKWAGQAILEHVPKGKIFGYAPIPGVLSLRQKWLAKISGEHPNCEKFATMPIVTNGITHGLALASRLFLDVGQTLVTADKSWENYEHIFTGVQGLKVATFSLFDNNSGFNIRDCINICRKTADVQGKVILLLNFPHNQTGFTPSASEAKQLGSELHKLCSEIPRVPFVVLLDDAYEGYVYDDAGVKKSILSEIFAQLPNLTVVKMDGISKALLAYGYRIAFLTFFLNLPDGKSFSEEVLKTVCEEIDSKVGGLIRGEISQVNHHGQILADALMDEYDEVLRQRDDVILMLKKRWEVAIKTIKECYTKYGKEKLIFDPCNSGFFCYANLAKGIDPVMVAERLIKEKGVGVVPSTQGLRIAFCGVPQNKIEHMIRSIFETLYYAADSIR